MTSCPCTSRATPRVLQRQFSTRLLHPGPACRELPLQNRSEEHTSELQSQSNIVCRLLLEKKKNQESSATNVLVSFKVRVTGLGVNPPVRYKSFELLDKDAGSMTRQYVGHVLGLAITKRLY